MTIEDLLSRLDKPAKNAGGWVCRCPAHEDNEPSLSVSMGDDGRILMKCHAGCGVPDICRALNITVKDLFPEATSNRPNIVATYPYRDEAGDLLFEVCRLEPKSFRQRRPDPDHPGKWLWKLEGVRRVLYRLPEIMAAALDDRPIYVCEGEKDVAALVKAGFEATCNAGGAGKWLPAYTEALTGAEVIVIADKDEPGRKHARQVAASLHGAASSIKVLELPDVNGKAVKDAHDYFAAGGESSELDELVQNTPLWSPQTEPETKGDDPSTGILLGSIPEPRPDDGTELIKDRYLCRAGIMLLVGGTGLGKSVLALQLAIAWSVGLPCLGFRPAGPLRSLFCQSENDSGDLWEMRRGIYAGLQLSQEQAALADQNVIIATLRDAIGTEFIAKLGNLLARWHPDLGWIDPLLGFIGADVSKQEATSQFLRAGVARLALQHNCGAVLVHHPPKPPREQQDRKISDWAYAGAGSADIANLARAVVAMDADQRPGYARLILGKRGKRLGWVHEDCDEPRYEMRIAYGAGGGIYWREARPEEAATAVATPGKTADDVLALVPVSTPIAKDALVIKAKDAHDIGRDRAKVFIGELVEAGRLHVWRVHRPGTNPAKMLARKPQPEPELIKEEAA